MKTTTRDGLALTSFTFGAMSLGNDPDKMAAHVGVARAAMESGVWFHASQEYAGGGAFMILRHAFMEAPAQVPKLILKIRCDNAAVLKFDVDSDPDHRLVNILAQRRAQWLKSRIADLFAE